MKLSVAGKRGAGIEKEGTPPTGTPPAEIPPTGTPPTIRAPGRAGVSKIGGDWWQKLLVVNGATKGKFDKDKLIGDPERQAERDDKLN